VEQSGLRPHFFWYDFFHAHKPQRSREERVGHGVDGDADRGLGPSPVWILGMALADRDVPGSGAALVRGLALAFADALGRHIDVLVQQARLPQALASSPPGGRPYVPRQRAAESYDRFEELSPASYPRPYPRPSLCDENREGKDIFFWKGRRWALPHSDEPYRYLCVLNKKLEWCWPVPPHASAVPCRNDKGDGWCWRTAVSYRDDG